MLLILTVPLPLGASPAVDDVFVVDAFVDDGDSVHEAAIDLLAAAGVTRGCNPPTNDRFCPDRTITRAETATLLGRGFGIQLTFSHGFSDVGSTLHESAIGGLVAAGFVKGCNPPVDDLFCPERELSRAELATMLVRAAAVAPADGMRFADIETGVHAEAINALAAAGIVRGCNPPANDRFCPDRPVTRGEMATMLVGTMDSSGAAPPAAPAPPSPPPGEEGEGADDDVYPGRPPSGRLMWGAAIGGNDDPYPRHEEPTGEVLSIRRTFFQWDQIESPWFQSIVEEDIAVGRLPWVSFKPPLCEAEGCSAWQEVAEGDHDHALDSLLIYLDSLAAPVWLTVNHEPEGGNGGHPYPDDPGGPAWHVAMNRHVAERIEVLGVDNVALGLILMGWTFDPDAVPDPADWWGPGIYDFLGVDPYTDSEESIISQRWWGILRSWADERGVDVAVGEWGMRGTDAAAGERVQEWFDHAAGSHADGGGARVVALAAFDSGLNAPTGSWELEGEQLAVFQELMSDGRVGASP